MVNLNLTARYVLTNAVLDSSQVLSSTSANDSLIIQTANSDGTVLYSHSWYFTEGNTTDTFRLHTVEKGDYYALDISNFRTSESLVPHFFSTGDGPEYNGQFWSLKDQDDGSVKLSNGWTGGEMYLEVFKDDLSMKLTGGDTTGQNWILSQLGSPATTTRPTGTINAATVTPPASTPFSGASTTCVSTASSCIAETSSPTASLIASSASNKLKTGVIVGIAVGAAAAVVFAFLAAYYFIRRRRNRRPGPGSMGNISFHDSQPRL
ncbi:hypothetical protein CC78DRAFT_31345 [Lojkania enalia]|uniref:Uncharacterized protein n=1 Tax=Lojkania enalia TaxID=147567 RepID=A0A9P4KH26_9PLEO|nr:hypothetical protein CC78DRAFT_31345 [Didymosphaeria enalia]